MNNLYLYIHVIFKIQYSGVLIKSDKNDFRDTLLNTVKNEWSIQLIGSSNI
jgi:hypothetical protein